MSRTSFWIEAAVLATAGAAILFWTLAGAKPRLQRSGKVEPRWLYVARRVLFAYCGVACLIGAAALALFPTGLLPQDTLVKMLFGASASMLVVYLGALIIFPGIAGKGW